MKGVRNGNAPLEAFGAAGVDIEDFGTGSLFLRVWYSRCNTRPERLPVDAEKSFAAAAAVDGIGSERPSVDAEESFAAAGAVDGIGLY